MHIAILSDLEAIGGANIAAYRLSEALAGAGHRITRLYQTADVTDPRWDTHVMPSTLATHLLPPLRRAAARLVPQATKLARHHAQSARQLARLLTAVKPDVINIHNLHLGQWSPELIGVAAEHGPTVCTLHDTWTFTGRCVFPGPCVRYVDGCSDACPTADEYPALPRAEIRAAWESRRSILSRHAMAAVSPSAWLAQTAARGLWRTQPIFEIPNPIDLERFSPFDRRAAKVALGIPADDPVLFACASELSSPRKGIRLLFDALASRLAGEGRVHLILAGLPVAVPSLDAVVVHRFGYVEHDRLRAILFNAADVFVHPAIADNAPLTVVESLSCGTPVVAFPVDGLPETVIDGETGWRAREVSSAALRESLDQAFADVRAGRDLRASARAFAERRYRPADVAAQYLSVFRHVAEGVPAAIPVVHAGRRAHTVS
jgi:glycosyltransferase involved in cell wall biosynthesis